MTSISWLDRPGSSMKIWMLALFLALLPVSPGRASEGAGDAKRSFSVSGWLEISAQGQVTAYEPDPDQKLPDSLHASARALIEATVFEPAKREGQDMASRSWLQATLKLEVRGEDYAVTLDSPHLGPRPSKVYFPRVRARPSRPIRLLLSYQVTAEGKVEGVMIETLEGDLPSSAARELKAGLLGLRFEPVTVGGMAVASTLHLPVCLQKVGTEVQAFELPALPRDPTQPAATGHDGYLPELCVSWKQVFSGSFPGP